MPTLMYPSPGMAAVASSSHDPNCRNETIDAAGSNAGAASGTNAGDEVDETVVVGELGAGELDVGALVVGAVGAGLLFGAFGRPLPLPLPCAPACGVMTSERPITRTAARGKERLVTGASTSSSNFNVQSAK